MELTPFLVRSSCDFPGLFKLGREGDCRLLCKRSMRLGEIVQAQPLGDDDMALDDARGVAAAVLHELVMTMGKAYWRKQAHRILRTISHLGNFEQFSHPLNR